MNLKFTSSALSLTLAANAIVLGSSNSNPNHVKNVAASYQMAGHYSSSIDSRSSSSSSSIKKQQQQQQQSSLKDIEPDVGLLSASFSSSSSSRFGHLKSGRADAFFPRRRRTNKNNNANNDSNPNLNLRFLQNGTGSSNSNSCPATCDPNLCSCVIEHGEAYPCATELHAVCTNTTTSLSSCVKPDYIPYYENIYCPFASCIVDGASYEKCSCDFYQTFCDVYGAGYPDDAKTIGYCAIATCCEKVVGDDVGMGLCLTTAESSSPSGMPSGPTVSPAPSSGEPTFYPTKMETVKEDAPSIIEDVDPAPAPAPGPKDTPPTPPDNNPDTTFAPTKPPSLDEDGATPAGAESANSASAIPNGLVAGAMAGATMAWLFMN